jgi:hypothetical protein
MASKIKTPGKLPVMVARAFFEGSLNSDLGTASRCRQFMVAQGFDFTVATLAIRVIRREIEKRMGEKI